jgi:hypothetical protein
MILDEEQKARDMEQETVDMHHEDPPATTSRPAWPTKTYTISHQLPSKGSTTLTSEVLSLRSSKPPLATKLHNRHLSKVQR